MLQFTALLDPISALSPAGDDLSFSPEVDAINRARQFDDPSLDQGEWVVALKEADWPFVYKQCHALLANKTKDLQIAGWLLEAATKTNQFDGMAAGFALLATLCDTYWETLHPVAENGDTERRVGNLAWLITRSVSLAKEVPLTEGRETEFSWSSFEAARAHANAVLRNGESSAPQPDRPDLATMDIARRKSTKAFYENLIATIARTSVAVCQLERALDTRLGVEGPSFSPLKDILDTVHATAQRYGADVGLRPVADGVTADTPIIAVDAAGRSATGPLNTRDQALAQLRLVAEFFRRTEPHSPVAYLADKAATWGDMPLHVWLKSVVKDPASLAFIEEMLDVKTENKAT